MKRTTFTILLIAWTIPLKNMLSLSSIAARLDGMENEIDEDETEDPYADAFIDREYPVIDGEFSDDDESLN